VFSATLLVIVSNLRSGWKLLAVTPKLSQLKSSTTGGLSPISSSLWHATWCPQSPFLQEPLRLYYLCNMNSDERMGLSFMKVPDVCHLYISHIQQVIHNYSFCAIHISCVNAAFAKRILSVTFILYSNSSSVTSAVDLSRRAVCASYMYFLCLASPGHNAVNMLVFTILYVICLLSPQHTECWMPCANHGAVCTFEDFQ
jgi:hypothetical protein